MLLLATTTSRRGSRSVSCCACRMRVPSLATPGSRRTRGAVERRFGRGLDAGSSQPKEPLSSLVASGTLGGSRRRRGSPRSNGCDSRPAGRWNCAGCFRGRKILGFCRLFAGNWKSWRGPKPAGSERSMAEPKRRVRTASHLSPRSPRKPSSNGLFSSAMVSANASSGRASRSGEATRLCAPALTSGSRKLRRRNFSSLKSSRVRRNSLPCSISPRSARTFRIGWPGRADGRNGKR